MATAQPKILIIGDELIQNAIPKVCRNNLYV